MKFDVKRFLNEDFINLLPFHVAVLDKNFKIIWANNNFIEYFGEDSLQKPCFKICKSISAPCEFCKIPEVLRTGEPMTNYETLPDSFGRNNSFAVYFIPLKNDDRTIDYILEISTKIKDAQWQKEYNLLFERVPCYITVIDREFNIIRANEKFRETFGESRNKTCYEAYKKRKSSCQNCPAADTFADGVSYTSTQIGTSSSGDKTHYMVTTTPIAFNEKGVSLVMEISTDITEINKLQDQLKNAHDFYATIIQNATDGIIALDNKGKIQMFNNSARRILNWRDSRKPSINFIHDILPPDFFNDGDDSGLIIKPKEIEIENSDGAKVPVRFTAIELKDKKRTMGRVAFLNDLRHIKELEYDKIRSETEVKEEIFTALDKGLTILHSVIEDEFNRLKTSIKEGNVAIIQESLDLMSFKMKQTQKVKDAFIIFSKRHKNIKEKCDMNDMLMNIYNVFSEAAILQHLDLSIEQDKEPVEIYCNPIGVKACIDIMILNSLNALSKMGNEGYLKLKTYNDLNVIVIEVQHNACRRDIVPTAELIKANCFGISTAESILKEHHGVIDILSRNGVCTFKMKLPK